MSAVSRMERSLGNGMKLTILEHRSNTGKMTVLPLQGERPEMESIDRWGQGRLEILQETYGVMVKGFPLRADEAGSENSMTSWTIQDQ